MSLHVKVCSGADLKDVDAGWGKSDNYVVVCCGGAYKQTSVKNESLNPEWNEGFDFEVTDPSTTAVNFLCWDSDGGANRDEFVGSASIVLNTLRPEEPQEMVLQLLRNGMERVGSLTVELTANGFSGLAADVEKLAEQTQKLEEFSGQLTAQLGELEANVGRLEEANSEYERLNAELTGNVAEFTAQNEIFTDNNKALKTEVGELKDANAEYERLNGELEENVASLKEQNEKFAEQNQELEKNVEELNVVKGKLSNKVELLSTEVTSLQKTREMLDQQVTRQKEQNDQFKEELGKLQAIEEGMKEFAAQQGEDYAVFVNQLTSNIQRNSELLDEFEAENEKLTENRRQQHVDSLVALSNSFQFFDHAAGLSAEEFTIYMDTLGPELQEKFKEKIGANDESTFGTLDKDNSGTLNLGELRSVVDEMVGGI